MATIQRRWIVDSARRTGRVLYERNGTLKFKPLLAQLKKNFPGVDDQTLRHCICDALPRTNNRISAFFVPRGDDFELLHRAQISSPEDIESMRLFVTQYTNLARSGPLQSEITPQQPQEGPQEPAQRAGAPDSSAEMGQSQTASAGQTEMIP